MTSTATARHACPRCGEEFAIDALFCPTDGTPLQPAQDPYIGVRVGGDIELTAVIGSGAMGQVYRAHQRSIGRDVAVKVLRRELSSNHNLVARFQREAKLASRIRHAHVVEVYLAGQLPDGALYIVMEYLDGVSLGAALKAAGGSLPAPRALRIALQICDAVGEAHSHGVVHRDLKPDNVMLVPRGDTADWVKVLDFGIAKGEHGDQSMETAAGQIFGTARYISPEAAQGGAVGPASDVYSLATIVYETLSGRTPFHAEQAVGLLIKHIHDAPPDLAPLAPGAPSELARVVMDNLAKDPARRAPNAHVFGRALASAARAAGVIVPDDGAVARMSLAAAPPSEGTFIDAKAVSSPSPSSSSRPSLPESSPGEAARSTTLAQTVSDLPGAPSGHRSIVIPLLLTFVLGLGTALGVQSLRHRGDAKREAFVARTQRAFADHHYTSPKDENVRDLVTTGLTQWPDDPALLELRADATQILMTRAIALRSGGDIEGARDSARRAFDLSASSYTTKLLAEQYDGELRSLDTPVGLASGAPRVLFKVPPQAHPGEAFEVVGRVLPRSSGPDAQIAGVKISLHPTLSAQGTTLAATDAGSGTYTARPSVAEPGKWYVVFEAKIDGRLLRAERSVEIAP